MYLPNKLKFGKEVESVSKQTIINTSVVLDSTYKGNTLFLKSGAALTLTPDNIPNNFECYANNNSGGNVAITASAATGWTYVINNAAPVASGSFSVLSQGKCTIMREVTNQVIYILGDVV